MPKFFPATYLGFHQLHVEVAPCLSSVNRWMKEMHGVVDENYQSIAEVE